jgi:hypothetical protein
MNIAFTICSNNYLAHAMTVAESFLKYHAEFNFVIGLVDRIKPGSVNELDPRIEVIPVEQLEIKELPELILKFNITELNTAVKPSYFNHFFDGKNASKVIYLDPDILVKSRFDEVLDTLDQGSSIVLTPHICSPVDDGFAPSDFDTLRTGIFNLGFIAIRENPERKPFLLWWHSRVIKYGEGDLSKGRFYDQIWMNYVPVMFDNYFILRHPGYNVANWNWHERKISKINQEDYVVNDRYPLRFFHFSSYSFKVPGVPCRYQNRFTFENRPDLLPIFQEYQDLLLEHSVITISLANVYFYPELNKPKRKNLKWILNAATRRLLKAGDVLLKGYHTY